MVSGIFGVMVPEGPLHLMTLEEVELFRAYIKSQPSAGALPSKLQLTSRPPSSFSVTSKAVMVMGLAEMVSRVGWVIPAGVTSTV